MVSTGKDFLKGNDKDGETRKNAKLKERRNTGLQRAENRRNAERRNGKSRKISMGADETGESGRRTVNAGERENMAAREYAVSSSGGNGKLCETR